jgi:spore maturation protein CgeB
MMHSALFVGILSHGTTSESQAKWLERLTPEHHWDKVDTDTVFLQQPRISRSLAFRLRIGPAVQAVNRLVLEQIANPKPYDLIWINKGVLLWPDTVQKLRDRAKHFIYYTPDTAFHQNKSRFFNRTLHLYDLLVTTKSFEMQEYQRRVAANKLYLTTQGYDPDFHFPTYTAPKDMAAVLIGLCEPHRVQCVDALRAAQIKVRIGGKGWEKTIKKYSNDPDFEFLGTQVFGDAYSKAIGRSSFGLGLLSKKFPELHTTRTLEIPACGTVLATEKTSETASFFQADEALFFRDFSELAEKIRQLIQTPEQLALLTKKCCSAVQRQPFAYPQILANILAAAGIVTKLPTTPFLS